MRWQHLTQPAIDALDRERTVLVLPMGSVEQHGRHAPVGTDTMLAEAVAVGAAARLRDSLPVAVLPPPWYGYSLHHMAFTGSITLRSATLIAVVKDIVRSVLGHGFRRVLLLNGHGGNVSILDVIGSDLGNEFHRRARIASATYFHLLAARAPEFRESLPGGMGHACEFETSLLLHLAGDAVRQGEAVAFYPDPGSPYLTTDLFGSGRVRTYLDFRDLSETGTLGDPLLASAEKGRRIFDIAVEETAAFIRDFAAWSIDPRG